MSERKINLKKECGKLYSEVEEILFKNDPMSINFETNTDEYSPEVGTILPRLKDAKSESDVHIIVIEECSKWFDIHINVLKKDSLYTDIAKEIWVSWKKFEKTKT